MICDTPNCPTRYFDQIQPAVIGHRHKGTTCELVPPCEGHQHGDVENAFGRTVRLIRPAPEGWRLHLMDLDGRDHLREHSEIEPTWLTDHIAGIYGRFTEEGYSRWLTDAAAAERRHLEDLMACEEDGLPRLAAGYCWRYGRLLKAVEGIYRRLQHGQVPEAIEQAAVALIAFAA